MKQIRVGVFETNSSSTHSLTICTEEQLNDWKNDKAKLDRSSNRIVPLDENNPRHRYQTYKESEIDDENLSDCMESFSEEFITPKGEKILVWGYYGQEY